MTPAEVSARRLALLWPLLIGARHGRRPRPGHQGPVPGPAPERPHRGSVDPRRLPGPARRPVGLPGLGRGRPQQLLVPALPRRRQRGHAQAPRRRWTGGPGRRQYEGRDPVDGYRDLPRGQRSATASGSWPSTTPSCRPPTCAPGPWPAATVNDRLGDNVFVPSVGSAQRARFYGAQFILASPGRRPEGAVLVAKIPAALVKYVFLYRVPGASQFSFGPSSSGRSSSGAGEGARVRPSPSRERDVAPGRAGAEGVGADGAGDVPARLARPGRWACLPVHEVDGLFVGATVPAGTRTIVVRYWPGGLSTGFALAWPPPWCSCWPLSAEEARRRSPGARPQGARRHEPTGGDVDRATATWSPPPALSPARSVPAPARPGPGRRPGRASH